ncbi:MAG: S-layer homology domain-containing protein [Oscillospiraceae bacterium]|nr:S-layer homology domain-containing protein [Oscillospiraceae bacterium]
MKRILSAVLVLALLMTLAPIGASAAEESKLAALTFDDGPDPRDTPVLLDGLAQRGVSVTFFLLGQWAQWYPAVARRAFEEGHEIGCHSWDHPELTGLTENQVRDQFEKSYQVLDSFCGENADYLVRVPYGSYNSMVRQTIGRPLIQWNVDTRDWESLNAYSVRDAILRDIRDGAIILLHDIHRTSVEGVLMAIDILLEEGWEFVTVSELYRRRGVEMIDGAIHYNCRSTGVDLGPIPAPTFSCRQTAEGVEVTIASESDAPVYYTTDGSWPNGDSPVYTGPFLAEDYSAVRAVAAYKINGSRSATVSPRPWEFPLENPEIRMEGSTLVVTAPDPEAELYYTLDGTDAGPDSPRYDSPLELTGGCTIHAFAWKDGRASGQTVRYLSARGILSADLDPGAWYFEDMDYLASIGLLNGVGGGMFAPGGSLTRGMLVALLLRCSGESLGQWTQESGFADVDPGAWYAEAVEWAWRSGIVSGRSDTVFDPNGPITRQELCCVIHRFLAWMENPLPEGTGMAAQYSDADTIAPWAMESVEAMTAAGLIRGIGDSMAPNGQANRAQVATILVRMLAYRADDPA